MRVQVLLFASAREAAGCSSVVLDLPPGATVADARRGLSERFPRLAAASPSLRVAVDERFAADGDPLDAGSVLAVIPPVSGG